MIASVLMASVGTAYYFKNGRQMAAWIGLTPLASMPVVKRVA